MGRLSAVLILRLLLCLSLCCLPLAAQDDAAPQQQQTYPVRGIVINKFSGQPIARALVTMQGQSSDAVFTDSEGHFEFPHVPAGSCLLTVMRPGFTGSASGSQQETQHVQAGPNAEDATLALLPTGAISGQITLSTSDSAENIQVHLLKKDIQNGRSFWQQGQSRMTNSDGGFFFGNLEPGAYRVYTSGSVDPDPEPMGDHPHWGYPPEYFPGGADSSGDAALTVRPGQHLQADMLLTHEPFYSVTVSVSNSGRGANVQIYDLAGHPLPYPSRYNQRDRDVHLNLPKGIYRLEGESFGLTPQFGNAQITVQNGPVSAGLVLLPLNSIPVTIHREFTNQNHTTVTFADGNPPEWFSAGVNLTLQRISGNVANFAGGNLRHAPNSTDSSAFILENVRPGSYWVQTNSFQGYVASITSGGVDLTQQPLVVGPGGSSSPIDITLRDDGATLSIALQQPAGTAGNAEPTAYVSLIPESSVAAQVPQNMRITQATQISNLPPGSYRVIAFDAPQQLDLSSQDAVRALVGKGQTVTLAAGASAQITLDITAANGGSQ
ncbi:carboxypeptidase-like regulatory domain-containing protein [Acidobacterium sp. S8]|uniref:carboxypeptidase-like regulatory domain-containing protein n=1 Tax=Acidobacterium sp. S8 TaxID=1641854 RepID=UPI00131C512E|nr:carboxypeptidase-like regulatory domain-containing protein [Acidobacterium sp. S8]